MPAPAPTRPPYMLIEQIQVKGYKSLVDATLHVRPLTLLAGTNSSGKSSIMQPLLLIKQTMEAPYQPAGALVLDGAHVQAETAGELVSRNTPDKTVLLTVRGSESNALEIDGLIQLSFLQEGTLFSISSQRFSSGSQSLLLTPSSSWQEISSQNIPVLKRPPNKAFVNSVVQIKNAFLRFTTIDSAGKFVLDILPAANLEGSLVNLMHIPGLRNRPERSYPATTFQNQVKGTFDFYAAGTISQWQQEGNIEALTQLNDYLRRLGLTDSVTAKVKNANEVELSVSRLPAGSKGKPKKADLVNIADVGIGVSQVLPILVALIAAQEGQLVYVEQPELHLHPRAQVVMAELLAEAANRGVRVIVETHSSLLLLTVQTLIAENKIKNTDVGLHWFARDAKGATQVTYVQPDEDGAYGDWPEDFGDVELKAQDAYLTAVGLRHFGNAPK